MKKSLFIITVIGIALIVVQGMLAQEIFDAVRSGDLSKVKELVEKDPQLVKVRNTNQSTPLHVAVNVSNMEIVKYLIEKGADVNSRNEDHRTAISYAKTEEIADYLLEKGVIIQNPSSRGGLIELKQVMRGGFIKYLDKYIKHGFDPFFQNESRNNLIHYAAESNSTALVTKLIELGVSPNSVNIYGWNPLHVAVYNKNKDVAELLIRKGIDKNARTANGKSPYNLATEVKSKEVADYLISIGADTNETKFPELTGDYFSAPKPGKKPEIFAPGIVAAQYQYHSTIIFSPNGDEAYWSEWMPTRIHFSKRVNGKWTEPVIFSDGDVPFISPDGKKFYFVDREKKEGSRKEIIYVHDRTDTGWSEPRELSEIINSVDGIHWQVSLDKKENIYFGSWANYKPTIYYSEYKNGKYSEPKVIEEMKDIMLISPYISPDGSYLLATEWNEGSLNIFFRKKNGSWTKGMNLSKYFQLSTGTMCSFVTHDGKYLFFNAIVDRKTIPYWVDASFIKALRKEALKDDK